jgi:uncharacterized protein
MQLNEIDFKGQPPVDGYGPGFFRVGGVAQEGALFLTADGVGTWGGLDDLAPLIESKDQYDVIFIGMGADIAPLPKEIASELETAGVPFEVMGSASACRTYNILLSEDRRVGLAVLPV